MPNFRFAEAEKRAIYEVAARLVATKGEDPEVWEEAESIADDMRAQALLDFADSWGDTCACETAKCVEELLRSRAAEIRAKHPLYRKPEGLSWVSDEAIVRRARRTLKNASPEIKDAWAEFCRENGFTDYSEDLIRDVAPSH